MITLEGVASFLAAGCRTVRWRAALGAATRPVRWPGSTVQVMRRAGASFPISVLGGEMTEFLGARLRALLVAVVPESPSDLKRRVRRSHPTISARSAAQTSGAEQNSGALDGSHPRGPFVSGDDGGEGRAWQKRSESLRGWSRRGEPAPDLPERTRRSLVDHISRPDRLRSDWADPEDPLPRVSMPIASVPASDAPGAGVPVRAPVDYVSLPDRLRLYWQADQKDRLPRISMPIAGGPAPDAPVAALPATPPTARWHRDRLWHARDTSMAPAPHALAPASDSAKESTVFARQFDVGAEGWRREGVPAAGDLYGIQAGSGGLIARPQAAGPDDGIHIDVPPDAALDPISPSLHELADRIAAVLREQAMLHGIDLT